MTARNCLSTTLKTLSGNPVTHVNSKIKQIMAENKSQQAPVTDPQVERIIENVLHEEVDDIPVVDALYNQDEFWIDAIDVEVDAEQDAGANSPWIVDVREAHLIEHTAPLVPIELESDDFQYDEEQQVTLRYADHFEW